MKAIISDVHANLAAIQAVLADIARQPNVTEIYNLGDVVGYGPEPHEASDLVWQHCKRSLLGNHDYAVLDPANNTPKFTKHALSSTIWTNAVLTADKTTDRLERFRGLQPSLVEGDVLYVHASPRNPMNEYVFPDAVQSVSMMEDIFGKFDRWAFGGHTHQAGVFTTHPTELFIFTWESDLGGSFTLPPGQKAFVNVGSVGQPRDGNPNACYVLFDGNTVSFRRVGYDVEKTADLIRQIPDLDVRLAERLFTGR